MTSVGAPSAIREATADGARSNGGLWRSYLRILQRRWRLLALVSVGAVVAIVVATLLFVPPYAARAVLQVPTTWTGSVENVQLDLEYTERLINTYVALSDSGRLRGQVEDRINRDDAADLKTEVEVPANTELLIVHATASDPELAVAGADAMAQVLEAEIRDDLSARFEGASQSLEAQVDELNQRLEEVDTSTPVLREELLTQRDELQRSYAQVLALGQAAVNGVSIIEPAQAPETRSDLSLMLAFIGVALIAALLLVVVVDRLDPTVHDVAQAVAQDGHVVLGSVHLAAPAGAGNGTSEHAEAAIGNADASDDSGSADTSDEATEDAAPADANDGESEHAELAIASAAPSGAIDPQALRLAYRLKAEAPRRVMATSVDIDPVMPTCIVELCRALASVGVRVVVVDTTIGPATLGPLLGVETQDGELDVLRAMNALPETPQPSRFENVHVVRDRWPTELIAQPDWPAKALEQLVGDFDLVMAFVADVLHRPEASLVGGAVDGTILLARNGRVTNTDLRQSLQQIEAFPSAFLGTAVVTVQPTPVT